MKLVYFYHKCLINFFRTAMRISWGRRFGTCNSSSSMGFWRWNGRWRRRTWYVWFFLSQVPMSESGIHEPRDFQNLVRDFLVLVQVGPYFLIFLVLDQSVLVLGSLCQISNTCRWRDSSREFIVLRWAPIHLERFCSFLPRQQRSKHDRTVEKTFRGTNFDWSWEETLYLNLGISPSNLNDREDICVATYK